MKYLCFCLLVFSLAVSCQKKTKPIGPTVKTDRGKIEEVKIINPSKIMSTYKFAPEEIEELENQDMTKEQIDKIQVFANETKFPSGIKTLENRLAKQEEIKLFKAYFYASFNGANKAIILIPKDKNQHMPASLRPTEDFYFIIGVSGITKN